jgi:hypothetical protein
MSTAAAQASTPVEDAEFSALEARLGGLTRVYQRQVGGRFQPSEDFLVLSYNEMAERGWADALTGDPHRNAVYRRVNPDGDPALGAYNPYRLEDPPGGFFIVFRHVFSVAAEKWTQTRPSMAVMVASWYALDIPVLTRDELQNLCKNSPELESCRNVFEIVPIDSKVAEYAPYSTGKPLGGFYKLGIQHTDVSKRLRAAVDQRLFEARTQYLEAKKRRQFLADFRQMMAPRVPVSAWPPARRQAELEWEAKVVADRTKWVASRQNELEDEARAKAEDATAEEDARLLKELQDRQARRATRLLQAVKKQVLPAPSGETAVQ